MSRGEPWGPKALALNHALRRLPRAMLGFLPTPLDHLPNLGRLARHPRLYVKRDDLTGLALGGGKVRGLEFLLGQARAARADVVLAGGSLDSNLCRLAAAAAARLGMECVLVHNDDPPARCEGNALLDRLLGARQVFLGPRDEEGREQAVCELAARLDAEGRRPFVIAAGGSTPLGAIGFVAAALELHRQSREMGLWLKHVVIAGGMGGTAAGLVLGSALLGCPFLVHVISVEYQEAELRRRIEALAAGAQALLWPRLEPAALAAQAPDLGEAMTIHSAYLGPAYGVPTPRSRQALHDAARSEALLTELVYTSKALAGCLDLIRQGAIPPSEACCFWHTGGTAALFGQAEEVLRSAAP